MRKLRYGELDVQVGPSNDALGESAAEDFARVVNEELGRRQEIAVILATGNSQLTFIRAVRERSDIPWDRISVLHMDEYYGMSEDHPASFRRWMKDNLLRYAIPKDFFGVRGDHQPIAEELSRYTALLRDLDPVICVMGIGENGHLAFNDPPADFETDELIHLVTLDETCRRQQVGEGHFSAVDETPEQAVSLTVPALLRPRHVMVLAPESRKSDAVKRALEGPVTPECPASILTTTGHARLYLDEDSAAGLAHSAA